jgi:NADPH-dependent 2,4-dienoyl-CoA reductase/sulfur reductase-like enzyme
MEKVNYLVVGGGMAADAAVKGIRELDPQGSILMISSDENPPYNRPPLSKALWKGKPVDSIWRQPTDDKNYHLILGWTITAIDADQKTVTDDQGLSYGYDKLLLATGGSPRKLPFEAQDVIYYRTFQDYRKLALLAEQKNRFAVIGSGFIGSEIAAALAMNQKEVMLFDIGSGIGWNIFPEKMVAFLNQYYQEKKVQVLANQKITVIQKNGDEYLVSIEDGGTFTCDGVVAGVGIAPNLALAESNGLNTGDGILVDEYLRTSSPDIFAAGDVANFHNPLLGKRIRVEHADNANAMGKQAGRNMADAQEPYDYLPLFYSDLFDLGYEAVGELDSRMKIIEDWQEPFQKGVLYYLDESRVRGVLLWNVWDQVDAARQVIGMTGPVKENELIGRIT